MRQLLRAPGGYWTAFFHGFIGTLVLVGGPIVGLIFEARQRPPAYVICLILLILFVASILVGAGFVLPRWLYARAYRRLIEEDQKAGPARDLPW